MKKTGSTQYKFKIEDYQKGIDIIVSKRIAESKRILGCLNYLMNGCIDELSSKVVMTSEDSKRLASTLGILDNQEDYIDYFDKIDKTVKTSIVITDCTDWRKIAWTAICYKDTDDWLRNIQKYLDPKYRFTRFGFGLGAYAGEENKKYREVFDEWFKTYKASLEVNLVSNFYDAKGFNAPALEILKRRFKENWSEKVESQVNVTNDNLKKDLQIEFKTV